MLQLCTRQLRHRWDNVFTYVWSLDVKNWDPARAASSEPTVLYNIYEPLVWGDAEADGSFRHGLAESWSVDGSGLVLIFNLHPGPLP